MAHFLMQAGCVRLCWIQASCGASIERHVVQDCVGDSSDMWCEYRPSIERHVRLWWIQASCGARLCGFRHVMRDLLALVSIFVFNMARTERRFAAIDPNILKKNSHVIRYVPNWMGRMAKPAGDTNDGSLEWILILSKKTAIQFGTYRMTWLFFWRMSGSIAANHRS